MLACRARACIDGRLAPSVDDVWRSPRRYCAIAWRSTSPRRAEGVTIDDVIAQMAAPLR